MDPADVLVDGPADAATTVVLAHGAGAGMRSPFLATVARGLAGDGLRVARFDFPYVRRAAEGARPGRPDAERTLLASWREVIALLGGGSRLIIGGKSLGGRMASMVADEVGARGLVCLGYPFHAPGRPDRLRTAHLESLATPALIVQGARDPFGKREEVERYALSPAIAFRWLEDGDHSFKPRKASGHTAAGHLTTAVSAIAEFARDLESARVAAS